MTTPPAAAPAPSYASASLYVGDLHPDVGERELLDKFTAVGPVASIRVCRDMATRQSLGYAYVNFHSVVDAKRALDTLNNTPVKGKPARIMWSQRDPSVRKSGVGNVFIKNLDASIDHQTLYDTFSRFGNILSCKVATNDSGVSKGYGFVHFETQEAADTAIAKVTGMSLAGQKVFVGPFMPRKERGPSSSISTYTNIYVKDLDEDTTTEELRKAFEKFGPITSCVVQSDEKAGKSKGFGFVNFEKHEDAEKAVEEMNDKPMKEGGKKIYAGRAQKKQERESELRQKSMDRAAKYQGVNLYVKNLEDDITDEKLREEFKGFGSITSCRIMRDDKANSKGFGFVCFSSPEEATRAANDMNGKMLQGKPLYVALAQRKDVRRAQLEAQHAARAKGIPTPGGMPATALYPPNAPPVFYPPQPQQFAAYPQQMGMARNRWPQPAGYQNMGGGYMVTMHQRGGQAGGQAPHGRQNGRQMPNRRGGGGGAGGFQRGGGRADNQHAQQPAAASAAANPTPAAAAAAGNSEDVPLAQKLTQIPTDQQFNVVGEALFPLVEKMHAEHAGKITGMLLDRYSTSFVELANIMETPDMLQTKVNEAMGVLNEHAKAEK